MQEVHEPVAFVEFRSTVHWQVQLLVSAFMSLVNFTLQLFLSVLVRDVTHHYIGSLFIALQ